ncbi:hypothetical protein ACP4OV_020440 [Aristida adscensionis]
MAAAHGGGDRLSALPDATLARILSHLPTDEAARTSALSRRWRHVHAAVPVVHLVDGKIDCREHHVDDPPACFEHKVAGALLCRDPRAPIRALRLDVFHPTVPLLDQWLLIALDAGADEVDVKLRYWNFPRRRLCPFGPHEDSSGDFDYQIVRPCVGTPARLFRSATLRRLRLTQWTLDVPRDVPSFPSLETLVLERIMARGDALQRLVSGCPNLAALTLEECPAATEVAVPSARLRSFAMACCHQATGVVLETPRLRALSYKGGLPPPGTRTPFFSLRRHGGVASLTVDICEDLSQRRRSDVAAVTELIGRCANLTSLHLALRPEMAYYSTQFAGALRGLRRLTQLELTGCLDNDDSVAAVAAVLRSTRKLEVLSLFPLPPDPRAKKKTHYFSDSDSNFEMGVAGDENDGDYRGNVHVPRRVRNTEISCFRHRLRRINLVGYGGRRFEKVLAKFLLSEAAALEKVSVSMAPQLLERRHEVAEELKSWRRNPRTRVTSE